MNQWWGYIHTDGSVQVKRYFDNRDLQDAYESPFVQQVIHPFEADGREQAIEIVHRRSVTFKEKPLAELKTTKEDKAT